MPLVKPTPPRSDSRIVFAHLRNIVRRYIQNLKFLQDFWADPVSIQEEQEAQVQALVAASPGLSVANVLEALLGTYRLFTDLTATSLMHHGHVALYCSEAEATSVSTPPIVVSYHDSSFPTLVMDGCVWFVESMGEYITLRPEIGEVLTLSSVHFHRLLQEGVIRSLTANDPSPTTPEIRQVLLHASPKTQKAANQRLEQLLIYVQGRELTTPERTVQRWISAYHAAEEQYGCGYIGLLDHVADRGNRTPRISDSGVTGITPDRLVQTGVSSVGCPECVLLLSQKRCPCRNIVSCKKTRCGGT